MASARDARLAFLLCDTSPDIRNSGRRQREPERKRARAEKRIARFRAQEMPAELDAGEQKNGKRQGGFRGPEGAVSKALAADGQ